MESSQSASAASSVAAVGIAVDPSGIVGATGPAVGAPVTVEVGKAVVGPVGTAAALADTVSPASSSS